MNAYIDGKEEDHEKFLEYSAEVGAYELKYQVLTGISEQLDKVNAVREKGLDAKLIYATGWNALFSLSPDYICTVLSELMWSLRLWQVLLLRTVMALIGAALAVSSAQILGKLTRGSMAALLIFTGIQLLAMLVSRMTDVFFVLDISSFFGYVM